jgi:hypothetical protein
VSVGAETASSGSPSPAPGSPHEIHVVSRVLLRRFTDPTTKKLAGYHLASRREYDKSPRSVGRVEQFVKYEPEAAEAEWQTIETRLRDAFKAVDDGSIFSQPDHIEAIKDCIALHWARSKVYKELHETLLEAGREWHKQQWQYNWHLLVAAFVSKYGLYPAGPEALDHINDLVYRPPDIITSGELFAARVRLLVNRARDYFKDQALQIGRATGSEQLLIGDAPVLCFKRGESGLLRDFRAPLFEAMPVVLPIGPRHVATLGGQQKWISLESSGIEKLNLHQVLAAKDWVMYHPSSGLMSFVDMIVRAMDDAKAG